jgi:hypothetical protein
MWDEDKIKAMKIGRDEVKHYSTKSISGKYNTRIFEFVKSFTQNFNSKTTDSNESITIKEIELHLAMDRNEIMWLLDSQNIQVSIQDRTVNMYVGSTKQLVD